MDSGPVCPGGGTVMGRRSAGEEGNRIWNRKAPHTENVARAFCAAGQENRPVPRKRDRAAGVPARQERLFLKKISRHEHDTISVVEEKRAVVAFPWHAARGSAVRGNLVIRVSGHQKRPDFFGKGAAVVPAVGPQGNRLGIFPCTAASRHEQPANGRKRTKRLRFCIASYRTSFNGRKASPHKEAINEKQKIMEKKQSTALEKADTATLTLSILFVVSILCTILFSLTA